MRKICLLTEITTVGEARARAAGAEAGAPSVHCNKLPMSARVNIGTMATVQSI